VALESIHRGKALRNCPSSEVSALLRPGDV
jgi:hypothetical protein